MDEVTDAAGAGEPRAEGGEDADFFAALIARSESASRLLAERRALPPPPPPPHYEWLRLMPTAEERQELPIGSLPHAWLQMTASMRRHEMGHYLDGVSMLLELALRGLLDVPPVAGWGGRSKSGSDVVVGAAISTNPALDGARKRLRSFGEPLEARSAAARIAPYVAALAVPSVGVEEMRARITEAIVGDRATDVRTALIVWLLKQDPALGDFARKAIFPGRTAVTRRAVHAATPDLYAEGEYEVTAAAHRVLFATLTVFIPGPTAL